MYLVTVFQMIDYEALNDTSHVSISGGIATHSFNEIAKFKANDLAEIVTKIESGYGGKPFIFEDRLELQVSDSETLSFYIAKIQDLDENDLKQSFPNLEVY